MTITAKPIASSICQGKQITTLQLRYPRFIHAEFMTHRAFSRNASSSRAIPVERLIEDIRKDTAMPIHWGKNQPGMQARQGNHAPIPVWITDDEGYIPHSTQEAWLVACDRAIEMAEAFHKAGYHKQIVNRLLEPFSHINVVVTATEWDNFFELRDHQDAQPEIRELAIQMKAALASKDPIELKFGEYHLPYVDIGGVKQSVARCARVSYLTHDRRPSTMEEDVALFDRLVGSKPLHASPLEHQATPDPQEWYKDQWGNFKGWRQYRQIHC